MPDSISHSHIVLGSHPMVTSCACDSLSLETLRLIFWFQYSTLLFGILDLLQPCQCQKHPCTKMAIRYLGSTKSGVPGSFRLWSRNLYPALCSDRRTNISGTEPFEGTRAIILLLVVLLTVSMNNRSIFPRIDGNTPTIAHSGQLKTCAVPGNFLHSGCGLPSS